MNYIDKLSNCELCFRKCKTNRLDGSLGYCKAGMNLKVARAALHHWEEPCISGKNGSGTVFFSHCNLSCVFCQNHEISQEFMGKTISIDRLSEIFLELQSQGSHNINLVTPTHYVPQIIEGIKLAKANGLFLPIVYNSNGYDTLDTIKLLKGFIDVYLPDFKYFNEKYSIKYSGCSGYMENLIPILKEMFSQVGPVEFDLDGSVKNGLIIRHLMLPGLLFDSKKVMDKIYELFQDKIYVSIMNQYTPTHKAADYPEINKSLNAKHYDALIDYALSIGITKGFIQESGTNSTTFIPSFRNEGV